MTAPESGPAGCDTCAELLRATAAAERAGDFSKAVDCRVLLRRHQPHHNRTDNHHPLRRDTMTETTVHSGGDKLPGKPYPGPHQPPTPDGGPGVPNPPKAGDR